MPPADAIPPRGAARLAAGRHAMLEALTGRIHDLASGQCWSATRLSAEVRRRASVLARFGGEGERAFVIAHADSVSFFADLFAVWRVGGLAVCVNPRLTGSELDNVVRFVEARAVLVETDNVTTGATPVLRTVDEPAGRDAGAARPGQPDDPALILFTSGTTGAPKGVVHSHRSLAARVALNHAHIGRQALARTLNVLPTHFGHGLIGCCLTPLCAGGDLFLRCGAGVAGAAGMGETIDHHRITFSSGVPSFWKLAVRASRPPGGASLRRLHVGSAPLSAALWRSICDWAGTREVANAYGITETANWVGGALASRFEPEDGLLGELWGGEAAVAGADGEPCPRGEGEILLRVPSLMRGYHRRDDLSSAAVVDGWYRTGDTGRIDEHGVLRLLGRNRHVINRAGIKVHPEEIDLLLEGHVDVEEACTFGIEDAASGEEVGVAVRLRDGSAVTATALADWLRARLRPDALPRRIFEVPRVPRSERGKPDRQAAARLCLRGSATP